MLQNEVSCKFVNRLERFADKNRLEWTIRWRFESLPRSSCAPPTLAALGHLFLQHVHTVGHPAVILTFQFRKLWTKKYGAWEQMKMLENNVETLCCLVCHTTTSYELSLAHRWIRKHEAEVSLLELSRSTLNGAAVTFWRLPFKVERKNSNRVQSAICYPVRTNRRT